MVYVIYRDRNNQWRWRLFAANHKILADSGEGYHNLGDCQAAIVLVKQSYSAPVQMHQG